MKKDAIISTFSFIIFASINLSFGLFELKENHVLNLTNAIDILPLQLLFCFVIWLLNRIKSNLRKSLRTPFFRTVFWLIIAIPFLGNNPISQMASGDFIVEILPFTCFYLSLLEPYFEGFHWMVYIVTVYIFGIAIYQVIVLEISRFQAERLGID